MDKSVTIATHVGPLMTQIRDSDTVQSFMEELKSNINRGNSGSNVPSWHFLLYKSRILNPDDRLVDVVSDTSEALVYVHPFNSKPAVNVPVPNIPSLQHSPKSSPVSTVVSIPINTTSSIKRRSSVSILPNTMPPASYFNAANLRGLEGMGFSELRAMQALLIFDEKFDLALDWLLALENPEDSSALLRSDQDALNEALVKYRQSHP